MKHEASNAKRDVLVCFAVKEEAVPFRKLLAHLEATKILISGIGGRNARCAFNRELENFTPALVITCGFAGALDPNLKVGDVIFADDTELHKVLMNLGALPARIYCAPRIAISATEKRRLFRETAASAVEMESGVIQEICRERGIPCATVRVISDAANEDLPLDFNALMTADQKISFLKLAGALLKSPQKISQLLKLQRNTKMAAQRLAKVLGGLLRAIRSSGVGLVE